MNYKIAFFAIVIIAIISLGLSAGLVYKERQEKNSSLPTPPSIQAPKTTNETQTPQPGTTSQVIQPGTTQSNEKPNISWKSLIPDIKAELQKNAPPTFPIIGPGFGILKEEDVTGDGIPEAFINIGTGGAYTDSVTIMIFENNQPKLARFKDKSGKITPLLFSEGASVVHGVMFDTIPEKRTIYEAKWTYKDTGDEPDCDASAYRWNANLKIFEFDENLSMEVQQNYCARVKSLNPFKN